MEIIYVALRFSKPQIACVITFPSPNFRIRPCSMSQTALFMNTSKFVSKSNLVSSLGYPSKLSYKSSKML